MAEGQPLRDDDDQSSLLGRIKRISGQPELSGRLEQHLELPLPSAAASRSAARVSAGIACTRRWNAA